MAEQAQSLDPNTGRALETYRFLTPAQLDRCLDEAQASLAEWRNRPVEHRARSIARLGHELEAEIESLALQISHEMGKPIRQARSEVQKCVRLCVYYAEHGPTLLTPTPIGEASIHVAPLGVILGVMPWNYPVWQALRFAVPTLLAGNGVLLKPAPNVIGTNLTLERVLRRCGIGAGIYSTLLVPVDAIHQVIADPRVAGVSLTGSKSAGQSVAETAGRHLKPSVLELGGSDPFIVFEDADLDSAANAAVASRSLNSGQSCIAAKRFLVASTVGEAFTARVRARLAALRVGDPMNEETDIGPLARADLVSTLHAQVTSSIAKGARCELGGAPLERPGSYYPPTLLTNTRPGMAVFDQETFGPVAAVCCAESEEELVALANQSSYGLGASLFTSSKNPTPWVERLDVGMVTVNGFNRSDPKLPFGGVKHSGYGRELGREGLLAFTNIKSVWVINHE